MMAHMRAGAGASTLVLASSLMALMMMMMAPTASAEILRFTVENLRPEPSVASPAFGLAALRIDTEAKTLKVLVGFGGLTSLPTVAHIHGPTANPGSGNAGVITPFTNFPLDKLNNGYINDIDLSDPTSYSVGFLAANGGSTDAAFSAFLQTLLDKKAYINIHTQNFGSGEIRGFVELSNELDDALLFATGENVVIGVEPSTAVYTDTLYASGGVDLNPQAGGPIITNKLAPGSSFDLGESLIFGQMVYGIRIAFPGVQPYSLYSSSESNADGQVYVRVSQLSRYTFRFSFEDRLSNEPDRPEAPSAPKDFNDFVFTSSSLFYVDLIDYVESVYMFVDIFELIFGPDGVRPADAASSGTAMRRSALAGAAFANADVKVPSIDQLTGHLPQKWKDMVKNVMA